MNMVCKPANLNRIAFQSFTNSAQIFKQGFRNVFIN